MNDNTEMKQTSVSGSDAPICSALLDLFLGWSLLRVIRTTPKVFFEMGEFGPNRSRMITENRNGQFKGGEATMEGLTNRILASYGPTLEQGLSGWTQDQRSLDLGWWDAQEVSRILESPLAVEFLNLVKKSIQSLAPTCSEEIPSAD